MPKQSLSTSDPDFYTLLSVFGPYLSMAGNEDSGPNEHKMIVILSAEPAYEIQFFLPPRSNG
jgi:hypothetical protein